MAALIEDQIHQFLIEKEEERCKALEAEYNKSVETKGETVKRKKIPKPWSRPCKNALCQDIDLLIKVDEYDYDLLNIKFQEYCLTRGVLYIAGEVGSRHWDFFVDVGKTKSEYLEDPYFQSAIEVAGKRHSYTNEEMESGWTIIIIGRGKLQDCWELYSKEMTSKRL
jgi:hypothetical protein